MRAARGQWLIDCGENTPVIKKAMIVPAAVRVPADDFARVIDARGTGVDAQRIVDIGVGAAGIEEAVEMYSV
jgi:hypothetical protein